MSDYYTQSFSDLRLPGEKPRDADDKCIPRFHTTESLKNGEIIRIEMVEIITPGDRLSRPIQKVTEQHRYRWPQAYQAFKAGISPELKGTPIATWEALSWSMQNDMRALGFNTIEQLAEANDSQLEQFPNGMMFRKKAQLYVQSKKSNVDKDAELNELRSRLAKLEATANEPEKRRMDSAPVLSESKPGDVSEAGPGQPRLTRAGAPRRKPGRKPKSAGVGAVQG